MKKIMVRADDLGFSKAINYGIYETLKNGVIRNIGFMVNMPDSLHGYELVKDYDICLGQHTNVCVGKPISDPKDIPTLVNADGTFKTSKMYRSTKEDFVDLDEAILEVEAQYNRFKEITEKEIYAYYPKRKEIFHSSTSWAPEPCSRKIPLWLYRTESGCPGKRTTLGYGRGLQSRNRSWRRISSQCTRRSSELPLEKSRGSSGSCSGRRNDHLR